MDGAVVTTEFELTGKLRRLLKDRTLLQYGGYRTPAVARTAVRDAQALVEAMGNYGIKDQADRSARHQTAPLTTIAMTTEKTRPPPLEDVDPFACGDGDAIDPRRLSSLGQGYGGTVVSRFVGREL